jgi:transposase
VGAQELSTLLWRERETLELLLFKLEEEQLLLTAGRNRWLPHATREVEQVLARLRESGLERAVAVSALAEEYGIAEEATLKQIVEAAPTPAWTDVFASHLAALEGLAAEIAETSDALAGIDLDAGTYDASGTARQHDGARLFQADA